MNENIVIKSLKVFQKKASKLMTTQALEDLYIYLSNNPESGNVISGTEGVRKLRWKTGKDNKGKSGGVRVIYYYESGLLVILLSMYSKSDKANLSASEKNEIKKLLPVIIKNMKEGL